MEILKAENLTKIYGKNTTKVVALDNVSFSVEKGEFVAIVGASGSGKSTLLHLIGGVDKPTSGKVYIDGNDIYSFDDDKLTIFRRRQVGLIYQFYNLISVLDVEENITLPINLDNRTVDKNYLDNLIKTIGLEKRRHHLPNELSGGQQQRTSIGLALITNPTIILADEPTGNLDSKASDEIEDDLEVNKIIKLIEDINHKNYELKLDDLSEDKISILKQEIYKTTVMLREQADNSLKDKISLKESLQDISHQLKTPLTSITIMLDNMIDNPDMDNIVRDKFIRQIKREVLNITFLVQSILTLSKFESNTISFIEEDNNIKDIIDMAISNVANLCDLKDIKIIFKGKNSKIYCDFRWQVEAITNILKNAISGKGSKIIIEGMINNLYYEIKIRDYGKGMDKEDVDNIFKRFYKGKMSSGDSVGIGLSLSKKIIEKDNGMISVDSTKGEGTTFIIKYFK